MKFYPIYPGKRRTSTCPTSRILPIILVEVLWCQHSSSSTHIQCSHPFKSTQPALDSLRNKKVIAKISLKCRQLYVICKETSDNKKTSKMILRAVNTARPCWLLWKDKGLFECQSKTYEKLNFNTDCKLIQRLNFNKFK